MPRRGNQVKTFFNVTLWPDQEDGFFSPSPSDSPSGLTSKFLISSLKTLGSHPQTNVCFVMPSSGGPPGTCWFTIGLFGKSPQHGRGKASDVAASPGFVADIDCRGGVHNEKNLPTKDEASETDSRVPFQAFPPHLVRWWISSLLALSMSRGYSRPSISGKGPRNYQGVGSISSSPEGKRRGWKLDSVGSVEHLFRVPGTFNHKGSPVPVEIVEVNNASF